MILDSRFVAELANGGSKNQKLTRRMSCPRGSLEPGGSTVVDACRVTENSCEGLETVLSYSFTLQWYSSVLMAFFRVFVNPNPVQELGLIPTPKTAAATAAFLKGTLLLDKSMLGEYLSRGPADKYPFNARVRV